MKQVRWHPVMIKWCLNLKLLSSSAYHASRTSGFVKLPSERTLRDYTNYFANKPGFMDEVDEQVLSEVSPNLSKSRRFIALLVDKMKVKEGLVYNKHSGEIIGFTNLGDLNDDLLQIEQGGEQLVVAKHVLVVMVRGIMFKLEFPLAHFGTRDAAGDICSPLFGKLFVVWRLGSLKYCVSHTADGASPNRKFFRMHCSKKDPETFLYKACNVYSPYNRWLYFVSDPSPDENRMQLLVTLWER